MKSKGFIVALLIVGFLLAFASAYVVDETEQVVVTQFGKVVGKPKKMPGLYFKVPFIQQENTAATTFKSVPGDGDVLVAGGTVEISGTVTEDVRAAGGTIRINGTVDGNCTIAGGSLVVGSEGVVKDNLLAMGGTIRISGRAEKEVKVFCEELTISGTVGQDLHFAGERIEVLEGSTIGGDATIDLSERENAHIAEGAVRGNTTIRLEDERPASAVAAANGGSYLFRLLYALSLILMAALSVYVLPKKTQEATVLVREGFGMTFLWGFLGLLVVPLAIVLLMIVIVGIPLGLFVLALYLWFLYLSQLSLPLVASTWVTKDATVRGWKLFWPMGLGVVILQLVMLIPYLGFLVWLVGAILGTGALLRLVWSSLALASKA